MFRREETVEWWDDAQTLAKVVHYFDSEGFVTSQLRLNRRGYLHSGENDEPACTRFRRDGTVSMEGWHYDGDKHRDTRDPNTGLTLPALITYKDGISRSYAWYLHGRFHNADRDPETGALLPAWIDDETGKKEWALASHYEFFLRPDGPEILDFLAAWEEENGVSGYPMTKSASKT